MKAEAFLPARASVIKSILAVLSLSTGKRVSLIIGAGSNSSVYYSSNGNQCRFWQLVEGLVGEEGCKGDQTCHAAMLTSEQGGGTTLCHAGLFNSSLAIGTQADYLAVLQVGEIVLADEESEAKSQARLRAFCQKHGLDAKTRRRLQYALRKVPRASTKELEQLGRILAPAADGLHQLLRGEQRGRREVEDISHALQIRVQAVLALVENLQSASRGMSKRRVTVALGEILHAVLATATVANLMEEYLREYKFQAVDLRGLVRRAARLYRAEAARRGIRIELSLPRTGKHGILVKASPSHLELALNNLVHNAVKYSFHTIPTSSRVVRIRGQSAGLSYRLMFENYGVGILPEEIAEGRLYEDGYRGELTQGEYRTGAGKGMGFVKRVIEAHGGRVRIVSRQTAEGKVHSGMPHLNQVYVYVPYRQERD